MSSTERLSGAVKLRKWLERNDKSQEWLALEIDVAQSAVSLWVRGATKPRIDNLAAIAKITGIPISAWI